MRWLDIYDTSDILQSLRSDFIILPVNVRLIRYFSDNALITSYYYVLKVLLSIEIHSIVSEAFAVEIHAYLHKLLKNRFFLTVRKMILRRK